MKLDFIQQRLSRPRPVGELGDAQLERRIDGTPAPRIAAGKPLRPAAVLVGLVDRPQGFQVLLTQRTDHLNHHPGQISFPGGRLEEADRGDPVVCALRETAEEIGLEARHIRVLGDLAPYVTGTGFAVTPVVGLVTPPFQLTLDAFEVADVFEVPLEFILDKGNHRLERRQVEGRDRPFWAMSWQGRTIWGATAGMLVHLSDLLAAP